MGWTGRRLGGDRHPVPDRDHQPDHRHVAGSVLGTHGGGGRAVHRLAAEHRGRGGPDRRPGQGRCGRVPDGVCLDGSAAGDHGQPGGVDHAGGQQLPRPEHRRDRPERGRVPGHVDPGRAGHGHLQHELHGCVGRAAGSDRGPAGDQRRAGRRTGGQCGRHRRRPCSSINWSSPSRNSSATRRRQARPGRLWPPWVHLSTRWFLRSPPTRLPRCCRCRPRTTWACWAARPLVCS